MSKYLNVFNTLAEYQAFSASTEYVQPNVALVKETNVLYYDYGDNKPKVDMSDYKLETEEISVGGNKYGKEAIIKINYIPNGITSLQGAFGRFTSLVSVLEIPSSVTNMSSTFNGCTSLINAPEIPSGVTNMSYTFNGCTSLKEVTFLHTTPPSYDNTLFGCSKLETIYVPDKSVNAYKTATRWLEFASRIKPLSEKPSE